MATDAGDSPQYLMFQFWLGRNSLLAMFVLYHSTEPDHAMLEHLFRGTRRSISFADRAQLVQHACKSKFATYRRSRASESWIRDTLLRTTAEAHLTSLVSAE
jgi:hypothetical protein